MSVLLRRIFSVFAPLGLLFASFIFVQPAWALTISPVIVDHTSDPGKTLVGTIRLYNETETDHVYYTGVQNFVAEGEDGRQKFLPETDKTGLVSWLKADVSSVKVRAGESVDVSWTMNIPKGAEPGGHYAALFFSTLPPDQKGSVGIGAKLGVLFLVNVNGDIREDAVVESFRVYEGDSAFGGRETALLSRLPADFELRIRNQGSVHLNPTGSITVRNFFGGKSAEIPVNPLDSRILPNSVRRVRSVWGPTDLSKDEGFFQALKNEVKGFALGRYSAQADVVYGSTGQKMTATVHFWVFPWHLLLIVLLVVLLLVCVLKAYNRMVISSAMSKKK